MSLDPFWFEDGVAVDGKAENANSDEFALIADNTIVEAMIEKIEIVEPVAVNTDWYYRVKWMITSGEYAKRRVSQSIKIMDKDKIKIKKAKNMLARLYLLSGKELPKGAPGEYELAQLSGKCHYIKIKIYTIDNKSGNWVAAVYTTEEANEKIKELTSKMYDVDEFDQRPIQQQRIGGVQSVDNLKSIAQPASVDDFNDDLPF